MCFIIFICCDTCNKYTSKCVEFFIFIISFLSFIVSIISFIVINKDHLTFLCFSLLIAFIFFSLIILFSICMILIFRFKQTINKRRNKSAILFSIIGLITTITFFICAISEISLIHSHYVEINHPCLYNKKNKNNSKSAANIDVNLHQFCRQNRNYNSHEISTKEFLIAYGFAAIFLSFMLSLIYSWFSEYRRIKYLINGSLNDFKIQENKKENNIEDEIEDYNKERENNNKNSNINYNEVNNEIENNNNNINDNKKEEIKKKLDKKNSDDGITIYSSKNNLNKNLEGSSDIMLTENHAKKLNIKKKK